MFLLSHEDTNSNGHLKAQKPVSMVLDNNHWVPKISANLPHLNNDFKKRMFKIMYNMRLLGFLSNNYHSKVK